MGDVSDDIGRVQGRCPACGNRLLFLGSGGYVTCSLSGCPDPGAASDVLDLDHRHIVELGEDGWSLEHPATCRTRGRRLLDCGVHDLVAEVCDGGPPKVPGRYVVVVVGDGMLAWAVDRG